MAISSGTSTQSSEYQKAKQNAHPKSRFEGFSQSSANPVRAYAKWLKEDPEYIKFINPGDLRIAETTCGQSGCHSTEVYRSRTSMMSHGAMLWGAALYNNGSYPMKDPHFGESYGRDGTPQIVKTIPPPTPEEIRTKGVLPFLEPLERWEVSQPGNVLRVFERGGKKKAEVGNPILDEDQESLISSLASVDSELYSGPIQAFSDCRKRACWIHTLSAWHE